MTDEKRERAMQEALDTNLEPEAYRKLMREMEDDTDASSRYDRLRDVDSAMKEAPMRSAPSSLMQGIMAQIANPNTLPDAQPLKSTLALAIGLGVTAVVAVPLLVIASLLLLALFGTGSALSGAAVGMMGVVVFLYTASQSLLLGAESFIVGNPFIVALVALVPLAWFGLWRMGKSWSAKGEQVNEQ